MSSGCRPNRGCCRRESRLGAGPATRPRLVLEVHEPGGEAEEVAALDPLAALDAEGAEEEQRGRRQLRNLLADAGWELLTPVPTTDTRYIDAIADPAQVWIYVVEAVDDSGNASLPATVTVTSEEGS